MKQPTKAFEAIMDAATSSHGLVLAPTVFDRPKDHCTTISGTWQSDTFRNSPVLCPLNNFTGFLK